MQVKRRSQKQEKKIAKEFNAKPTIASGSMWHMKADVRNEEFLIECKTTLESHYSVTSKVWEKIELEATKDGMRTPLLIVDLEDRDSLIVFDPKYFNFGNKFFHPSNLKGNKSFRIHLDSLEYILNTTNYSGLIFQICGKVKHDLCFMKLEDFKELKEK